MVGLASYELGDRIERLGLRRMAGWPDLVCGRYETLLAFDHARREVLAIGPDSRAAPLAWLDAPPRRAAPAPLATRHRRPRRRGATRPSSPRSSPASPPARSSRPTSPAPGPGGWRRGARPYDLFARLADASPAPFAAYLRLPGLAVVCNSPERFLQGDARRRGLIAETRPIKGTVPRGATPAEDERLVAALAASEKDRAENLMIVDLMRNDLARVSTPGTVRVPALFAVERFANVSHLVSTVTADAGAGPDRDRPARRRLPARLDHRRAEGAGDEGDRRAASRRAGRSSARCSGPGSTARSIPTC